MYAYVVVVVDDDDGDKLDKSVYCQGKLLYFGLAACHS